jgi:transcriptional regulator of acetoin/glycerol metabolism
VSDESLKTGHFMNASLPSITIPTLFRRRDAVEVPVEQVQLESTEASQNISDTFKSFLSNLLSNGDIKEVSKVILQKLEEHEQRIRKLEETPPQDYQSSRGTEDSPPSVSSMEKMIEVLLQILQRYRESEQLVNKRETENQARN